MKGMCIVLKKCVKILVKLTLKATSTVLQFRDEGLIEIIRIL